MLSLANGIGGYLELELPPERPKIYPEARRYQSARAAFYALLLTGRPRKVWMPMYICDSMLAPLKKAGIEFSFYSINKDFSIKDDIELSTEEWILYVNYFGVCASQQRSILQKYNPKQVIFDHSQAFYAPPLDCLATIYSPRKFFGVPDGGLLVTNLSISAPEEIDNGSVQRSLHLLKRLAGTPESGYADYQAAEKMLEDIEPRKMSILTERILSSVDYEMVRLKRNINFNILHGEFREVNELKFSAQDIDGPLCYPLLLKGKKLHLELVKRRMYIAKYWPDVILRSKQFDTEVTLVDSLLPLPCDQRYGVGDMSNIIRVVKEIG